MSPFKTKPILTNFSSLAVILPAFLLSWMPGDVAFNLTTWLGYLNSCINPLIYTIFNPEFRKAFKKILGMGH